MVSTPNYQLFQPDDDDFVDVFTQIDDNFTKIDQDMNRYDIQIFTASGTWTKPARCKRVSLIVVAGGVGGGSSGGNVNATGDDGGVACTLGAAALCAPTNYGGSSKLGGLAKAPGATGTGTAGKLYGGASSGATNYGAGGGALASLAGAAGIVIVINWY